MRRAGSTDGGRDNVRNRLRAQRPRAIRTLAVVALLVAGTAEAGKPLGGDERLGAIWQRKGAPVVIPAGVDLVQLVAEVADETPAAAASRALLAESFAFLDIVEIGIDDLEIRFYLTGGEPLVMPLKKKVKGGAPHAKVEMSLNWEGPLLVRRRTIERGATSVERLGAASDGTLRVELEWTGPPAQTPLRVVTSFNRLSGGFQ
jgi:hypothetical protein